MAGDTTRQRYLDAVVEHMVATGRSDLPLVVLAEAAGTSDRMLVYYFKTREALLTEAVVTVRTRRRKALAASLSKVPRASNPAAALSGVFRWIVTPDDTTGVRFSFDAAGRGFHGEAPFDAFLQGSIRDAVEEATLTARRMGADEDRAQTFGTLFGAVAPALAADLLATGDADRIDRSIDTMVVALLDSLDLPTR